MDELPVSVWFLKSEVNARSRNQRNFKQSLTIAQRLNVQLQASYKL